MNPSLIPKLKCPGCNSVKLTLQDVSLSSDKVNSGLLVCINCAKKLNIKNGILDCLDGEISPLLQKEIAGSVKMLLRERNKVDDQWLLDLPRSFGRVHPDLLGHDALADLKFLIQCMGVPRGGYVIDLGSGPCWASFYLSKWGYKAIAIDICTDKYAGLDSAEVYFKNSGLYFDRIRSDIESLNVFRDNSIDGIIAISAIHHSRDISRVIREAKRILRPGASFGMVEACCSIFDNKQDILKRSEEVKEYQWNENIYRITEFRKIFAKENLRLQVLPAESTLIKMNNFPLSDNKIKNFKYKIFKNFIYFFWKNPLINKLLRSIILPRKYWLVCVFVSLEFIGISKKNAE